MNSRTLMLRPRNLPLRLIKMEPQTPPKPPRLQQKKNTTMQSKCSKRQRTSRQRQRRSRQLRRRPRTSRRRTSLKMLVRSLRLRPSHSSRRLRKVEPQRKPKKPRMKQSWNGTLHKTSLKTSWTVAVSWRMPTRLARKTRSRKAKKAKTRKTRKAKTRTTRLSKKEKIKILWSYGRVCVCACARARVRTPARLRVHAATAGDAMLNFADRDVKINRASLATRHL